MKRLLLPLIVLAAVPATAQAAACPGNLGSVCPYDDVQTVGGAGTSQALKQGRDVATDGTTTYVADEGRVAVYDARGRLAASWPVSGTPTLVDVAPDDHHVIALDPAARCLTEFAPDGTVVTPCAQLPESIVGFAIAPDGALWASLTPTRIVRLGRDGSTLQTVIHNVTTPAPLGSPSTDARPLAVTPSGTLLIGTGEGYDELSPTDGATLRHVETPLAVDALATASDGRVFAAGSAVDYGGRVILRLTAAGTQEARSTTYYEDLRALAAAGADVLAVVATRVIRVAPDGTRTQFGIGDSTGLSRPSSSWGDGAGGLYVSDEGHQRVVHHDATGAYTGALALTGSYDAPEGPTAGGRDPQTGQQWVTTHGSLSRLAPDGSLQLQLARFGAVNPLRDAEGLQVASDGTVYGYVSGADGRQQLVARNRDGQVLRTLGTDVGSFALAPDGDLYVLGAGTLRVFTPAGQVRRTVSVSSSLTGIAIDAAGRLYFGAPGMVIVLASDATTALGGFDAPGNSLSFSDGRLNVTDSPAGVVRRYRIVPSALKPLPKPAPPQLTNVSLTATRLTATGRTVKARLICVGYEADPVPCTGKLRLLTTKRRALTAVTKYRAAKTVRKTVTLKLNAYARRQLKRHAKLSVLLVAEPSSGIPSSVRTTLRRGR